MDSRKVDLLNGPIFKNLLKLSAPLMATAFVQMTYNFTDMIWLGRLGTDAVAAVGVCGFFTWIAMSLVAIPRTGTAVYAAHYFGNKDEESLDQTIKNGLILNLLLVVFYMSLMLVFAEEIVGFYDLKAHETQMGVLYLRTISLGFFFQFMNPVLSQIYNATGDSYNPFVMNVIGLLVNVVLDPLLIFGWGFIPGLGVAGAAWATNLAQVLVTILFAINILKTKNEVYWGLKRAGFNLYRIFKITRLGLPNGLKSILHASISLVLSRFTTEYGSKPIAVYSVGSMIESISWMTTEGFQGGIIAFIGQNYGARKMDRLRETIKISMRSVISIGLLATFVLIGFRNQLFHLFLPGDPEGIYMGSYYLLILGFSQLPMAVEIGASGILNGLGITSGPAWVSMIFNLARIPFALALMPHFKFYGVWMAMTISSIIKGLVTSWMLYKKYENLT